MLANLPADILTIVFKRFNRALSWLKKLINQTNQKWFSPSRPQKNPPYQTNQKRLIPIEHCLRSNLQMLVNQTALKKNKIIKVF